MEEFSVEHEDAEEGPAHCTSAEGELILELRLKDLINFEDIYADMPPLIPPSSELSVYPEPSVRPDLSACLDFPLSLPLLPHPLFPASAMPPLSPDSPSAHPQPTICSVGLLRVCQFPSVSWLEDPLSPPPASESWTPPQPSDPAAPPQLLAPLSPPLPVSLPAQSSVALALPRTSGSPPRSPEPWSHRFSVSTSCSAAVSQPPGVVSSSSTMAPPSVGSAMGRHHGCSLGLTWLVLLRLPSVSTLAPPSRVEVKPSLQNMEACNEDS
ncbi:hypothetical protein H4Q32_011376 [Labeo rohita]|uniref:Uncharacterized protein n=1 Tax=Labeo rohita TaxID=84645 RepID=A0ABQ8LVG1_LABRO|nr:hypothetical protein H4Q32_011376 [Labeo rohita]